MVRLSGKHRGTRPAHHLCRRGPHQYGLAGRAGGQQKPEDWEAEARLLTGQAEGDLSLQSDAATGGVRIAITQGGRITGLLFVSPNPVVVSRSAIIALIGTDTSALAALAGRNAADRPDPGATVCACFDVGRNTLLAAIAGGASTVAALGGATCAGTNCGSCKPELAALLDQTLQRMAAE